MYILFYNKFMLLHEEILVRGANLHRTVCCGFALLFIIVEHLDEEKHNACHQGPCDLLFFLLASDDRGCLLLVGSISMLT